ncbi:hypothetical protein MHYP_G00225250 [Metynnis hypsauchen]
MQITLSPPSPGTISSLICIWRAGTCGQGLLPSLTDAEHGNAGGGTLVAVPPACYTSWSAPPYHLHEPVHPSCHRLVKDGLNKARVGTCVRLCRSMWRREWSGGSTPTCAPILEDPNLRGINESTCSGRTARGIVYWSRADP